MRVTYNAAMRKVKSVPTSGRAEQLISAAISKSSSVATARNVAGEGEKPKRGRKRKMVESDGEGQIQKG